MLATVQAFKRSENVKLSVFSRRTAEQQDLFCRWGQVKIVDSG